MMESKFDRLVEEYQQVIPFQIRFKDESWEMQLLNIFLVWFCPGFLTSYTTVIGSKIYFPSERFIQEDPNRAIRILAHELVHLLDAEKSSTPVFMLGYVFPQVLALGVFLFPLIGFWALAFWVFLLPIPSRFRFHYEARAYAIDYITYPYLDREAYLDRITEHFSGWGYYKMFPYPEEAKDTIMHWVEQAENGSDPILTKVLLVYEMVSESGA
ncbi:MAG: hypothetical protein AAGC85_04015 [Bacteroidota bacterium]